MSSGAWVLGVMATDPYPLGIGHNSAFVVADTRYYRSKGATVTKAKVSWILVYCNNRLGLLVKTYGQKGRRVHITGCLLTRQRTHKKSGLVYTEMSIKASSLEWLDKPRVWKKKLKDMQIDAPEYPIQDVPAFEHEPEFDDEIPFPPEDEEDDSR